MSDRQPSSQPTAVGFYRAFEDKFRGSRELVKSRLRAYLPFIEPLKLIDPHPKAVDLGCGRGEWLELLTENGFEAFGVDLDDGMLAACHEKGFHVSKEDAIDYLKSVPEASQLIVSGFHLAEHLPFSVLQTLIQEAFRVLRPAGLLILETPNPENIRVGVSSFYLDPTHEQPLPSELLSFLPIHYGFKKVKMVRLQEASELRLSQNATLNDVLTGVSPDYAIVAQKDAEEPVLTATGKAFDIEYGLSLGDLTRRFDAHLEAISAQTADHGASIATVSNLITAHSVRLEQSNSDLAAQQSLLQQQQERINELAAQQALLQHQLVSIQNSRLWRLLWWLRWLVIGTSAWIKLKPGSRPRRAARFMTLRLANEVIRRPRLLAFTRLLLTPMPQLRTRLGAIIRPETERHGTSDLSDLNIEAEPEAVRILYERLKHIRRLSSVKIGFGVDEE